jgi:hypothetical protein
MLDFGKPPTVTAAVGAYSNSTFLTNGPPLIAGCSHCAQIDGSDPSAGYGASGPTAPCGCHTEMAIPLHSRHAGDPLYGRCALPPNLTGTTFSANANLDFGVAFIALRATPGSTTPAEVNALCMQHTYIFEDRHTYEYIIIQHSYIHTYIHIHTYITLPVHLASSLGDYSPCNARVLSVAQVAMELEYVSECNPQRGRFCTSHWVMFGIQLLVLLAAPLAFKLLQAKGFFKVDPTVPWVGSCAENFARVVLVAHLIVTAIVTLVPFYGALCGAPVIALWFFVYWPGFLMHDNCRCLAYLIFQCLGLPFWFFASIVAALLAFAGFHQTLALWAFFGALANLLCCAAGIVAGGCLVCCRHPAQSKAVELAPLASNAVVVPGVVVHSM